MNSSFSDTNPIQVLTGEEGENKVEQCSLKQTLSASISNWIFGMNKDGCTAGTAKKRLKNWPIKSTKQYQYSWNIVLLNPIITSL